MYSPADISDVNTSMQFMIIFHNSISYFDTVYDHFQTCYFEK